MEQLQSATTIDIGDVQSAAERLPEGSFADEVFAHLRRQNENIPRPEAYCSIRGSLVKHIHTHPFVAALHLAYAQHRPLRLKPDSIWLLICQGIAQHIGLHAEQLRSRFVNHSGQEILEVKVPGDVIFPGSPENPWPEVTRLFTQALRSRSQPAHDLLVADFSTTTSWEKTAYEIVLMKALEKYFKYRLGRVICGIPTITIDGTREDWASILDRLDSLSRLVDLTWWMPTLKSICDQFVAAVDGEVDLRFWRSIYRTYQPDEPCSPQSSLGWFTFLFPYLEDEGEIRLNPWLSQQRDPNQMWLSASRSRFWLKKKRVAESHGVFDRQLPTGVQRVPFQIVDHDGKGNVRENSRKEFVAGYIGIKQDCKTLQLEPQIGWVVLPGM